MAYDNGACFGRWRAVPGKTLFSAENYRRLAVAGLIVAFAALNCKAVRAEPGLPSPTAAGRVVRLRVMTYNIRFGKGWDEKWDLDRTAAAIHDAHPDLVGIQEADREWSSRSRFKDVVVELAERLGMFCTFSPAMDRAPGFPGGKFGNAILSRFPLQEIWSRTLPAEGTGRAVVGARVEIDGVPVNILTTHLGLSVSDRIMQVLGILRMLEELTGPVVITGDCNATAESAEIATLTRILQDAQAVVGKAGAGTYPAAGDKRERIDYIFVSPEFKVEDADVVQTLASDHLPVVADLSLSVSDPFPAG